LGCATRGGRLERAERPCRSARTRFSYTLCGFAIAAPAGYRKTESQRLEKDPDLRALQAIRSVFRQLLGLANGQPRV
jgi:hypothetical protein